MEKFSPASANRNKAAPRRRVRRHERKRHDPYSEQTVHYTHRTHTQDTHGPAVRNSAVDLIKSVAILDVLISHAAVTAFSAGDVGSLPWLTALFWACISHGSVSLFLMASGELLLAPKRELTLKKLYTKNMPRLLIALLFWACCYKAFALAPGALTAENLIQAAKEVILFRHEEHLYYLHIMLLVYAFLPLTRLLAAHMDRRQTEYALALWFLLGILYPTVRTFWPFTLLVGIPKQWLMNMTYASIGYTLLGWYIAAFRRETNRRAWVVMALAGFAVAFGGSWAASVAEGTLNTHFFEGMGLGMCLLAAGVYGLCHGAALPVWLARGAAYLSRASFCVFLTHIFFLKTLSRLGFNARMGGAWWSVPAVTLTVLACSCAAYEMLRRIPVARRWLV